ncbi:hypothetical protein C4587_00990 [Candidatus Parcubacteria bacterium]|nr:MAG: hypothetical protein C4587_00990 [Candidatus Parcubacteria bacterium]
MSAKLYNSAPFPLYDTDGDLASAAKAYFYNAGTSTPLTVYQDSSLTTPHTYPIIASANGVLAPIYIPYVDYRVRILNSSGALIFEADGIANPAPVDPNGSLPTTQLYQTGHTTWRLSGGPLDGFVRMNGLTIGSASSGATERANNDTQDLFTYLWNNLTDSIAPVSGGRGASAAADWAANKPIVVPSMQGRLPVGVDDMGGAAANVVQVSTTCSATNGSANITVTSAAGLGRGMFVLISGVAAGTITAISGTTVTLSTPYAGSTGGGKALRASYFSDAQGAGVAGGSQSFQQTTAELAAHNHGVTDPGHFHAYDVGGTGGGGAASGTNVLGTQNTQSKVTGITINNNGSGLPAPLIQPSRLVTFYIHL